jgi:heme-degrading monooxygenase HmoA
MIARLWRGWAANQQNADLYEEFLRSTFLPTLKEIDGYHGVSVLRRNVEDEIEFVTVTRFSSVDAIRKFAGDDYEAAHVAPRAKELLNRFDTRCLHLDLVIDQ